MRSSDEDEVSTTCLGATKELSQTQLVNKVTLVVDLIDVSSR